jgi:hypothetical protein
MPGEWLPKTAIHKCEPPREEEITARVEEGDRWKCICGRVWVVTSVWRGDQREPLLPGERPQIRWIPEKRESVSSFTREQILNAAIKKHNLLFGNQHCDPKYILSCNQMPNLIMGLTEEEKSRG